MRLNSLAVLPLLFPAVLAAQYGGPDSLTDKFPRRLSVSFAGTWVEPVHDFARNVGWGIGMSGSLGVHFAKGLEMLGLRTELSHNWYGWESKRVQLSPTANRVFVDMSTTNNIFVWTFGPELAVRRGPLRPYALWHLGFSNFYTSSSVKDENNGTTFASSTNMHDYGWATVYGGGLRITSSGRLKPDKARFALDIGGRMTNNGTRNYLRSGDITDQPNGSLVFNTRRTPANFLQFTLAVSASGM